MHKIILACLTFFAVAPLFAQNTGIGTTTPQAKLHIVGSVRMDTLAGSGKHLVYADISGNMITENSVLPNTNSQGGPIPYTCPAGGISRSILVTGLPGSVSSSNIRVRINITHTFDGDLYGYLIAPNGSILNLFANNGSSGDNFTNTVFSDGAAASLPFVSTGAPFTGTYKPTGNLSVQCTTTPTVSTFAGIGGGTIIPNGSWTLKVYDLAAGDDGNLIDWGITFDGSQPPSASYLQDNYSIRSSGGQLVTGSISDDGSGNIGIGIAPAQKLDINGTTKTTNLQITAVGTTGDFLIKSGTGLVGSQKGHGTLGINYIIALAGIFPSQSGGGNYGGALVGEIKLFAGTYAPSGWAFCQGQLLPIATNTALFSLLGTTYGGDGSTNFALPDLRGSVPVHPGTSPNGSAWLQGEKN